MTYNPKGLAVIIQCRLSSTRLPGKAVKDLGGRTVLEWTLASMKKVNAEYYYVATDEQSYDTLLPIVTKMGYQLFKGPLEDVLERYCLLIEKIGCKTVLRATADNPFLFYEAAELLCQEFEKKSKISKVDYMTMTGLPHGSGVEIFRADSLLLARTLTKDPFDHEHVGPSLYNHKNTFVSLFTKAPSRFYYPDLRTTIDTPQDYRRAVSVVKRLSDGVFPSEPYTTEEIVSAEKDKSVTDTVLFIPSIKKGQGTGHLRRCLKLANEINGFVYLSYLHNQESEGRVKDACQKEVVLKDAGGKENCGNAGWANTNKGNFSESEIDEINSFVKDFMKENPSFKEYQIVLSFPEENEYSLIVTDMFSCPKSFMELLKNRGKVLSIDEGSAFHEFSDYLLDIIPSEGLERDANFLEPKFMEGAKNKKKEKPSEIKNVLISFGGEDQGKWTEKTAEYFSKSGLDVSVILPAKRKEEIYQNPLMKELSDKGLIRLLEPYPELKESLYLYDLVLTHYGFTSYEALSANTHVILFPISRLHERLSKKYGFSLFDEKNLCQEYDKLYVESLLNLKYLNNSTDCEKKSPSAEKTLEESAEKKEDFYQEKLSDSDEKNLQSRLDEKENSSLSKFIMELSHSERYLCPVCQIPYKEQEKSDKIVFRTRERTFRRCSKCSMVYISFSKDEEMTYGKEYFAEEYKKQYGKTYLEDFASIKKTGLRRIQEINSAIKIKERSRPSILDVGCAYGPFLKAAQEDSWLPFGTDISDDAVSYVQNTLLIPCVKSAFPDFDSINEFGINRFDAVTMWFVIEHFKDLRNVLLKVSSLVKKGGVFAFSTPSLEGVSGKRNTKDFFIHSPKDHYSIWEPSKASKILKEFGFKVVKIVSTGHHPERFPYVKKHGFKKGSLPFNFYMLYSGIKSLGDTVEIYCVKEKD